jgi:hypothetical protein
MLRLSLLSPGSSSFIINGLISKLWDRFIEPTFGQSDIGKEKEANLLLALRAICNAFSKPDCFEIIGIQKEMVTWGNCLLMMLIFYR